MIIIGDAINHLVQFVVIFHVQWPYLGTHSLKVQLERKISQDVDYIFVKEAEVKTNCLTFTIWIWWKKIIIIQCWAIRSPQIFAHTTTAVLSWHVQKFMMINFLKFVIKSNKILYWIWIISVKNHKWNSPLFHPTVSCAPIQSYHLINKSLPSLTEETAIVPGLVDPRLTRGVHCGGGFDPRVFESEGSCDTWAGGWMNWHCRGEVELFENKVIEKLGC